MAKKRAKAGSSRSAAAERRRLFVEAYCGEHRLNATQSAIAAGFSKKTAYSAGGRLLKRVEVQSAIKQRLGEVFEKAAETTQLTANEVLQDLAEAMRFDPALLYNADGSIKPVSEMPLEVRRQLEGLETDVIKVGRGKKSKVALITSKVKFPKKSATREQAMKHFGLFEKDNRQKPPLPPILLKFV